MRDSRNISRKQSDLYANQNPYTQSFKFPESSFKHSPSKDKIDMTANYGEYPGGGYGRFS